MIMNKSNSTNESKYPSDVNKMINLIFVLCDTIESIGLDAKEELRQKELFKQEIKMNMNAMLSNARKLVRVVDKALPGDMAEHFGEDSDFVKEYLYDKVKIKRAKS